MAETAAVLLSELDPRVVCDDGLLESDDELDLTPVFVAPLVTDDPTLLTETALVELSDRAVLDDAEEPLEVSVFGQLWETLEPTDDVLDGPDHP